MGYFSNGSEGSDFEQHFCENCANMPESENAGCPVWGAHLFFAYELCNEEKHPGKVMLDMLIERTDGGLGNRCVMFLDKRRSPMRTVADLDEADRIAKDRPKLIDWPKQ